MDLFVVNKVDADSYSGHSYPISFHRTLEGAEAEIPEWAIGYAEGRTRFYGDTVRDYAYFTIEKKELKD